MMKKIPEGYKETELGVIPQEWEVRKVNENFQLYSGNSLSRAQLIGNEYFCVHYGDIHTSNKTYFCVEEDKDWLPKVDISKIKEGTLLETGDVVFADASEDYEGVGKSIVIFNDNKKILAGLHTIVAKSKKNVLETHFKKYFMNSEIVRKQFKKLATGSKVYGISKTNLGLIKFIYPPLPEQQKIAEILSSVDDHIEKLDETISEYELLKKGMMKKLLTEGIGHTEFKDTELGRIPKEWEVRKLGEVCDIVSGGTPKTDKIEYWENGDILWATPTDITTNGKYISSTAKTITKLGLQNSSARLVPSGSILMTSRATIGERSINTIEMSTNQGFKVLICKDSMYNEYIYYYIDILLPEILKNSSGSTFKEISKAKTENLLLSIPPLSEQQQIAYILSSIDERIDLYKSEKDDFMQVKKGLMEKLLTGKIRV